MKALPLSSKASLLKPDDIVLLSNKQCHDFVTVKSVKSLPKFLVLSFDGIADRQMASRYKDALVYVSDNAVLDEGEYLIDDILGLGVFTTAGDFVGVVVEIFETKASDVYVVREGEKEHLIPAVKEFIKKIDIQGKKIILEEINGLLG